MDLKIILPLTHIGPIQHKPSVKAPWRAAPSRMSGRLVAAMMITLFRIETIHLNQASGSGCSARRASSQTAPARRPNCNHLSTKPMQVSAVCLSNSRAPLRHPNKHFNNSEPESRRMAPASPDCFGQQGFPVQRPNKQYAFWRRPERDKFLWLAQELATSLALLLLLLSTSRK